MARRIDTRERTSSFPNDDRLRQAGWSIKSRPQRGADIWILKVRGEVLMTATTAEALKALAKAVDKYAEFAK